MSPIHVGQPWDSDPRALLLRPFEGTPEDYKALARVRNETMQSISLPEDFKEKTGQEMDDFYNRGDFFNLVGNSWLMFLAAEPVAAAVVYPPAVFHDRPPGNFDMYVVPRYGRHGLGSRLLAHLEQAAAGRGHPVLETTVAGEDERSTAFLRRHGFSVVGHSLHLARAGMHELPPVQVPDGYLVRSLQELGESPDLYLETANRLGSYDSNYSLIRPEALEMTVQSGEWEPAGVLFLIDAYERIVGVIRASGGQSGRGYLHEIRLEPSLRGKGLGTLMTAAALRYLAEVGVTRTELDTPGENSAAYNLALRARFRVVRHWLHFLKALRRET